MWLVPATSAVGSTVGVGDGDGVGEGEGVGDLVVASGAEEPVLVVDDSGAEGVLATLEGAHAETPSAAMNNNPIRLRRNPMRGMLGGITKLARITRSASPHLRAFRP